MKKENTILKANVIFNSDGPSLTSVISDITNIILVSKEGLNFNKNMIYLKSE